ncbi:MAG: GNAT family N-acetyltransferase [Clostridia bacterium]|nr:GNAT family N-acetyltransferase [Clostridia bacterium]
MRIEPITTAEVDYFYEIHKKDFPSVERRTKTQIRNLIENNKQFCPRFFYDGNDLVAYLVYWKVKDFYFIEHFAVLPDFRGRGYGTKILTEFNKKYGNNIIFEVEPPENAIAQRRIHFYEKLNFVHHNICYFQPSYRKKNFISNLKLNIMTHKDFAKDVNNCLNLIYQNVYGIESNNQKF